MGPNLDFVTEKQTAFDPDEIAHERIFNEVFIK
jgi:hypothetical protein